MFETGLKTGQEISFIPEIDLQEKARAMAYDFIEQMRAEGNQIPIDQDVINQHISHLYVVDKDEFFRLTDQLRGKINNTFLKALAKVGKVGGACFSFKAGSDELPYNIIYLDDNYSSDNTLAHEVQHAVDNIVGIKYKHEQTLDYALRPKLAYAGVIAGFVGSLSTVISQSDSAEVVAPLMAVVTSASLVEYLRSRNKYFDHPAEVSARYREKNRRQYD